MVLAHRSALRALTVLALSFGGLSLATAPAAASSCGISSGSTLQLTLDSDTQVRTSGGVVQYRPTPVDPRDQSGSWSSCPAGTALTISPVFSRPTLLEPMTVPVTVGSGNQVPQVFAAEPAIPVSWSTVNASDVGDAILDLGDGGTAKDLVMHGVLGPVTIGLTEGDDVLDLTGSDPDAFPVSVDAGGGKDTVLGGDNRLVAHGGSGDDDLQAGLQESRLYPEDGADVVGTTASHEIQLVFLTPDADPDQVTGHWGGCDVTFDTDDPVSVSLNDKADDGAVGEGDDIRDCTIIGGGNGDDVLDAGTEAEAPVQMYGEAGDDTFLADATPAPGLGGTVVVGGDGHDTLDLSAATTDLVADASGLYADLEWSVRPSGSDASNDWLRGVEVDRLRLGSGQDEVDLGLPLLEVEPGPGDDGVTLRADGMSYVAGAGADGDDRVTGAVPSTTADYSARTIPVDLSVDSLGGDGGVGEDDDLVGMQTLLGGSAADTLVGDGQANSLGGGGGADTLVGRGGADVLTGDAGADSLFGNGGDDLLRGLAAADTLDGGSGDDRLEGDSTLDVVGAADTLVGGPGDDDVFGYAGNDELDAAAGDDGSDLLVGGAGTDRADYSARTSTTVITLDASYHDGAPGEGDKVVVENLVGGRGADTLVGDDGANDLTGGPGRDVLRGNGGNDTFRARDRVVDRLEGGTGTDRANRDDSDVVSSVERRF